MPIRSTTSWGATAFARAASRGSAAADEPLVPLPVELGIKDPLPRPEIEPPLGHGHDDLVVHEHRLEVRVAVVFARQVVAIGGPRGRELLQPLPDVGVQAALVVVHEHTGRDVHRADQHEPLGHAALGEDWLEHRREVDELALLLGVEREVLGVRSHRGREA
jgi:hypothetical protein